MKFGLSFLLFALSCLPVNLEESESSGDVSVDLAKIEQRSVDGTSQGRPRLDYLFKVKIKLSEEALILIKGGATLKNASLFTPVLVGKMKLRMI